ncbi:MAG: alpha/beta fold hydrolase [Propionibacterium sp.]|nr:alpha/beta fold hydrolase [Propionibacterium sp.]MDN6567060.1 alpha/beta fold hydrolase [Actinomyces sp.]MDN6794887.1 alpha/beta fold hydrolase [Propionibacterium sp.]
MAGIWSECIHPGLLRGHNVLVFDGPGQQGQLFGRQSSFRPDWEHVLSPVLDTTLALDGIDADRVWVYGVSQGGFWVARALAFEHRFAAAVTDPGVVDVSTSWMQHLPARLRHLLERGDVQEFDKEMALGMRFSPDTARTWLFRARPCGASGYAETIRAVRAYNVEEVAHQITTPLLILSPEDEQFWPGQSQRLAELTPGVSTVVPFTREEGAQGHCQPLGRALTAQRVFDWVEERLGVSAP